MKRKEIAALLADAIKEGDIDAVWYAIGELEKGEGESAKCDECGYEHDEDNDLMTIKGDIK